MTDVSDFDDFIVDLKTQSAVERQLGIIGEALVKFEKTSGSAEKRNY
jgi:uncharacterized protein with HEPN domain